MEKAKSQIENKTYSESCMLRSLEGRLQYPQAHRF
jgi:hypothetical protein